MKLLAIGGDRRMLGAVEAARHAGWEGEWKPDGVSGGEADVVMLPWPYSFKEGRLVVSPPHEGGKQEDVLASLPACRLLIHGKGLPESLPVAQAIDPSSDELFLRRNAQLTAEGAICRAMQRMEHALLGSTCLITGYGRIGQELCARLCAMGAFVIVCARNEMQMRAAHAAGAHPVPLSQIPSAVGVADLILNTVPARVLGEDALRAIGMETLVLELASAPYGADWTLARFLGVQVEMESGVPGRYAPHEAGAALFDVAKRHWARGQEEKSNG